MKLKWIKTTACLIMLMGPAGSFAQQMAMQTQYIMNKLLVNPGYAGYREVPSITAVHRSQWLGFKGAPMTQAITFDTPLKKDKLAFGSTLIHDQVGPVSTISFSADVAYRLRLTNRATLSFGAKATAELFQANITDLVLISDYMGQVDEYFLYNTKNLFLPNVGFGVYYYKKNYFAGFSVPKMIRNKLEKPGSEMYQLMNGKQEPTFHMMGGYIFKVNKDLKIQPNFMAKGTWGAPLSVGMHCNAMILNQFNVGVFWYIQESAGLMANWQVDKQLKIGYSVDFPTNALIASSFGSHEVTIAYSFATRRKRIIYPRYF